MDHMEADELCFPHLLNTSCTTTKRSLTSAVLSYIFLSLISLLTVTLNMLVIISISHYKKLHTQTNFLLLSLAVSDFLVGFLILFQVGPINGCWYLGDALCNVYYVLDYTITSASIGNMVLISVDRYVAICDPLHYANKVTESRVKICICMCWACSTLYHCAYFNEGLKYPGKDNTCVGECVLAINYAAGIVDLFVSFIGPVVVIIVLYFQIFVVVVTQARAMRTHITSITLPRSVNTRASKSEVKAARTLGVLIVVFLVCCCPYFCVALTSQEILVNSFSGAFVMSLFYLNSCLNPLIYTIFYPWFKKSVRLIVTLQILQPDSCESNILEK